MREDRPSSTATLIAAATMFLDADARTRALVPDGAVRWCERCLGALGRLGLVRVVSHPALRWLPSLAERATVPGLLLHFMARKRWIEDAVRERSRPDRAQLVVIGAGFDTLALRLASKHPQRRCFEIDHPATQRVKRAAAGDARVEFVAADLSRQSLDAVLASMPGYESGAEATFVVEGLLMYLTDAQVDGVFRSIRASHRGALRVVFTVMEPARGGSFAFHNATALTRWLLSRWSEPFRSALRRDDAPRFLATHGLELTDVAADAALRERYLAPVGLGNAALAVGEILMVADGAGA